MEVEEGGFVVAQVATTVVGDDAEEDDSPTKLCVLIRFLLFTRLSTKSAEESRWCRLLFFTDDTDVFFSGRWLLLRTGDGERAEGSSSDISSASSTIGFGAFMAATGVS